MPTDHHAFDATGDVSAPLWQALRADRAPRSVEELHQASRAHPSAIRHRLGRWRRCGFVEVVDAQPCRYEIHPRCADDAAAPIPGSPGPKGGTPLADDVWRALRRFGRPATFAELLAATGAGDRPLYCRLWRWVGQGFVRKLPPEPVRFALTAEAPDVACPPQVTLDGRVRPAASRPGARARIWQVMRVLKSFDVPTLMMTAEVSRRAVDDYLNLLSRAGYVRHGGRRVKQTGRAAIASDWSGWQLLRDTGPKHPTFTSRARSGPDGQQLIDHNTGAAVTLSRRVPQQGGAGHGR